MSVLFCFFFLLFFSQRWLTAPNGCQPFSSNAWCVLFLVSSLSYSSPDNMFHVYVLGIRARRAGVSKTTLKDRLRGSINTAPRRKLLRTLRESTQCRLKEMKWLSIMKSSKGELDDWCSHELSQFRNILKEIYYLSKFTLQKRFII